MNPGLYFLYFLRKVVKYSKYYNLKCQVITFANSLDPDQARQNVKIYWDQNCFTFWTYFWKNVLKRLILNKKSADKKYVHK